jgi:hypothetical protein
MQMLKLTPTNHFALIETLYTALNYVRACSISVRILCRKSSKLFGLLKEIFYFKLTHTKEFLH